MVKTINLTANTEQAVEVTGGVHARFENMGDGTVYVSKTANVNAGGDGVMAVPSGATKYVKNVANYGEYDGEYGYQGTVYVKADTSCSVEIETGDYFFKSVNTGKGGAMTGKFVKIKGRVGTVDDLPLIADEGDLYFVGAELDEDSDEYVYTAEGQWELIGNTEVDLSGYVKTDDMKNTYGIETNTVPTIEKNAGVKISKAEYEQIADRETNGVTYYVEDMMSGALMPDSSLSPTSENAVQNKVIAQEFANVDERLNEFGKTTRYRNTDFHTWAEQMPNGVHYGNFYEYCTNVPSNYVIIEIVKLSNTNSTDTHIIATARPYTEPGVIYTSYKYNNNWTNWYKFTGTAVQ